MYIFLDALIDYFVFNLYNKTRESEIYYNQDYYKL